MQTDSPSLKLSLEASDEMEQIMRHIINHSQRELVQCICATHTTDRAYSRESEATVLILCSRAEPRDHYPSSTFIQPMAVMADWSIATT